MFKLEFEQRKNRELYELNEIYEERTKYNTKEKNFIFLIICKMGFLSNFVAVYFMLKELRIRCNTMITKPCTKKTFLEFIVFKY